MYQSVRRQWIQSVFIVKNMTNMKYGLATIFMSKSFIINSLEIVVLNNLILNSCSTISIFCRIILYHQPKIIKKIIIII